MATLYITEFAAGGPDGRGIDQPAMRVPEVTTQVETITASSTQTNALQPSTTVIRLNTDVACHVAFGANPTATTSSLRLGPNATEYFSVQAGQSLKLAVIAG